MQELKKILEEIEEGTHTFELLGRDVDFVAIDWVRDVIRKHMNDGWVSVGRELPPNAKHKGAFCPRYQVMTKYGVTEGWYNPDLESWYVLCWFIGVDYLETEIDFEKGTCPKVVRCENLVNDKHSIVLAWRPLPEPYRPERSDSHDGESSFN